MDLKNPRSLFKLKRSAERWGLWSERKPSLKMSSKMDSNFTCEVFMKMEVVTLAIDIDKGCKIK